MLIGGRSTGHSKNFRPWFFSLNPDMVPLPTCLTGNKNKIDNIHRHRSPLIYGHGMWAGKIKWMYLMGCMSCWFTPLSDGKPLMCGGAIESKECHSYEGASQIVLNFKNNFYSVFY